MEDLFVLDRLFWPFHVETEVVPPFGMRRYEPTTKRRRTKKVLWTENFGEKELVDRNGTFLRVYSGAPEVIIRLHKRGVKIAVAETTPEIATIRHVLHLFELDHFFSHMEIDLESPVDHLKTIKEDSELDFKDFVYLSSNKTVLNIVKKELKVITVHVDPQHGLNIKHMYKAIYLYNIRPYMAKVNGKMLFVGDLVPDEVEDEQLKPTTTITRAPSSQPITRKKTTKTTCSKSKPRKKTIGTLRSKQQTQKTTRTLNSKFSDRKKRTKNPSSQPTTLMKTLKTSCAKPITQKKTVKHYNSKSNTQKPSRTLRSKTMTPKRSIRTLSLNLNSQKATSIPRHKPTTRRKTTRSLRSKPTVTIHK